jgi:hypothetical protein
MLFALGAAASALDAIKSLTSPGTSSSQSTGFGAVDPFSIASDTQAAGSAAATTGFSAGSPLSPTILNTLLAAQSQSSTPSTASAPTSPADELADLSSQIDSDAGSSDSTAAASSYNMITQMFQKQINAVSFSAPPLSFSV